MHFPLGPGTRHHLLQEQLGYLAKLILDEHLRHGSSRERALQDMQGTLYQAFEDPERFNDPPPSLDGDETPDHPDLKG